MSYFELLEQFWQLDAERTIAPAASKLYFYLLNEFNSARPTHWPARLYRRATQVYADLRIDKKTLPTAVAALEERGLIRHYSGDTSRSGEWQLNYGPAAEWAGGMGKNSPQQPENVASYGEKFPTPSPEMAEGMGKNSPPIRNRQDDKRKDQTQSASAWVGEAAEEITLAPLPTEKSELVPPVALTPQPAAAPVEAVPALPEAVATEAKQLAVTMGQLWSISELKNYTKFARIAAFTKRLAQLGKLEELKVQFAGYRLQREKAGLRAHRLDDYLGHYAADFADGEWCGCDWPDLAARTNQRPGQAPAPSTRATVSPTKQAVTPDEW